MTFRATWTAAAFIVLASHAAPAGAGNGKIELDVEVGARMGALDVAPFDFGAVVLEAFANSPIPFLPDIGWIGDNPGWASPPKLRGDLLPLPLGANVDVELISLSPALRMFDPAGGAEILPGGVFHLGGPEFDSHPLWVIDATHPEFIPSMTAWTAAWRLFDAGSTQLNPSGEYEFIFAIPEPSGCALAGLGALFLRRVSRRGHVRKICVNTPIHPPEGARRMTQRSLAGLLTAAAAALPASAQHAGDVWVARTADQQISRGGLRAQEVILRLQPTDGGWIDSNPGFDHLTSDRPDLGLFTLEAGCVIRLEAVALDPGLVAIQTGTFIVLDSPGDRFILRPSGPNLHEHPLWFIDEIAPGFDPEWRVFHGTFRLVDTGATGYSASSDFTLKFTHHDLTPGDMNCDGAVTVSDIGGFVLALTDGPAYESSFPGCDVLLADVNDDHAVTVSDIGLFVELLASL